MLDGQWVTCASRATLMIFLPLLPSSAHRGMLEESGSSWGKGNYKKKKLWFSFSSNNRMIESSTTTVIWSFPLADDNQTKKMIQLHQKNVRNPLFASNNPTTSQRFPFPSNKLVSFSLAIDADSTSHPLFQYPEPTLDWARDHRWAVQLVWEKLLRWPHSWCSKAKNDVLERTNKEKYVDRDNIHSTEILSSGSSFKNYPWIISFVIIQVFTFIPLICLPLFSHYKTESTSFPSFFVLHWFAVHQRIYCHWYHPISEQKSLTSRYKRIERKDKRKKEMYSDSQYCFLFILLMIMILERQKK
jgi:hypothetical protein